ncbi:Sec-independent protein translocase protein TatB [Cohaesibacter celericrescens]|uniref:Sec-independent protein translocase protein TatB n=1 Tax=Cohaesibacter celericrescens TaxID=2067669 RepID=A0A2N5XSW6_9HYPH|nr:Sec-independent protein translocase protein TatB [Cohaesibacter celericrescens]PLW77589.1 twin-arginine translocase subunit TatB [Cohaesibacter celericrescens]
MFDIGWSEILVVVIITVLVVGPKELPGMLRTVGKSVRNLRRMAGDFQNQFNEVLKEAELDEVKNTIGDIRKLDPTVAVKDAVSKQLGSVDDLTEDLSSKMKQSSQEINDTLSADDGASNSDKSDLVEIEDDDNASEVASADMSASDASEPVEVASKEPSKPSSADDASSKADS